MSWEIRRIRPDEGLRLRALRLRALADAPTAFESTLAREEAFPEAIWHERALRGAAGRDAVTFIAEEDGAEEGARWIGLATGLAPDPDDSAGSDPAQSRPMLVGMFVDGTARRRGVGVALVESVVGWARARQAAHLVLWATSGNAAALALYRRCGFRPTGATKALAHDPALVEVEMVRALD
jgi:GNAT superfamily N-acetyltransferase